MSPSNRHEVTRQARGQDRRRWEAAALRGGRLGRARLPVDALRDLKIKPMLRLKHAASRFTWRVAIADLRI